MMIWQDSTPPPAGAGQDSPAPRDFSSAAIALRVRGLSVSFGRTPVLTGLSFDVPRGTSLGIIGPNGSGKTVLFRALIGAIPSTGMIQWSPGTTIGYVPQQLDLERDVPITGLDFLRARLARGLQRTADVPAMLARVGVPFDVARRPIGTLSGGQFQRLLVAFALLGHPSVLLLDEPTAGVDEPGQEQLNDVIRRLQRDEGVTVLFISHELAVVYRHATNVLCLSRRKVEFGPPRIILTPGLLEEMYGAPVEFHVHDH
jgi:zinc transport system ATP-binding protein